MRESGSNPERISISFSPEANEWIERFRSLGDLPTKEEVLRVALAALGWLTEKKLEGYDEILAVKEGDDTAKSLDMEYLKTVSKNRNKEGLIREVSEMVEKLFESGPQDETPAQ